MSQRQMHLVAYLKTGPTALHIGGWRHPEATLDDIFDAYVRRGGQISYLDPTVVLPIMAAVTSNLGLGATLSTSFHTAYHLARWLASLDILSKGRVAWNVVTSATDLEARNAGLDELPPRRLGRHVVAGQRLPRGPQHGAERLHPLPAVVTAGVQIVAAHPEPHRGGA